jgi:hypothetical protein
MMRLTIALVLLMTHLNVHVYAQSATGTDSSSKVPVTFLISEDDTAYGELVSNTTTSLLDVCDNAMDKAYKKWIYMLADLEEEADRQGFDVKGLKIWLNVFWNANGSIDHIVYYPKPNSKNIEYKLFTNFLDSFAETYKMDVVSENSFAHYGSASFPTFVAQMFPERNK